MGLGPTNHAPPLTAFTTTLGTITSIAGTVLGWPDEQFVFHYLDKPGRFILGDQSVASGA